MENFTIEKPTAKDAAEIIKLIYPDYFKESFISEGLNYSESETWGLINSCIEGSCFVAKAPGTGRIVAFCAMVMYRTFYKELLAEVPFFFIGPQCRGTKISHSFCEILIGEMQKYGVKKAMVTASSVHRKSNKLVENLWKKFGFEARHQLTMIRRI